MRRLTAEPFAAGAAAGTPPMVLEEEMVANDVEQGHQTITARPTLFHGVVGEPQTQSVVEQTMRRLQIEVGDYARVVARSEPGGVGPLVKLDQNRSELVSPGDLEPAVPVDEHAIVHFPPRPRSETRGDLAGVFDMGSEAALDLILELERRGVPGERPSPAPDVRAPGRDNGGPAGHAVPHDLIGLMPSEGWCPTTGAVAPPVVPMDLRRSAVYLRATSSSSSR